VVQPSRQTTASRARRQPAAFIAAAALLALLLALAAPTLLWAYHLGRAGDLLQRGLEWPAPRSADSLPLARDPEALAAAAHELEAARAWRPDHPHAYRLAGHLALAQGDWQAAAGHLEAARARAPRNPLIAWEAGLAYEQLWRASGDDALRAKMVDAWRAAGLDAGALSARAHEAEDAGQAAEAWYARAELLQAGP